MNQFTLLRRSYPRTCLAPWVAFTGRVMTLWLVQVPAGAHYLLVCPPPAPVSLPVTGPFACTKYFTNKFSKELTKHDLDMSSTMKLEWLWLCLTWRNLPAGLTGPGSGGWRLAVIEKVVTTTAGQTRRAQRRVNWLSLILQHSAINCPYRVILLLCIIEFHYTISLWFQNKTKISLRHSVLSKNTQLDQ